MELLQRALTQAREGPRSTEKKPIVALEARIQAVEERLSALAQRRILSRTAKTKGPPRGGPIASSGAES